MRRRLFLVASCFIVLLGLLTVTKPVWADEIVFQDDFSGDLHQWQQTQGLAGDWTITNGQLEGYLNNPFSYSELVPTDTAWPQMWQSYEYAFDYMPLEGADRNISFNVIDATHAWDVHFVDGSLNVVKFVNGQTPVSLDSPANVTLGHTYHIQIVYQTGLLQIFVDSQKILEQYDWTYDGHVGKIGIKVTTGTIFPTRVRFDNINIIHITGDGQALAVPILKQTDPQWADLTYDSAKDWSQKPTIGNWGCALTSMVMIMQYYGMQFLPDGQALTPATLNDWLTAQPDGYVFPGLVNWPAITRLTEQISAIYQTVKLEYTYQPTFDLIPKVVAQLEEHQPAIIEIPERRHFVTAIGYNGNHQDLQLNDPYFAYQKFSEYQVEDATGRLFQPSHTDLSYLELIHSPNIDIRLISATQQLQWQTITESLGGENGEVPPQTVVTELLAKPNDDTYQVQILRRDYAPYQLKVLTYDQHGQANIYDLSAAANIQPPLWTLQFTKQGPSQLLSSARLQDFSSQLDTLIAGQNYHQLSIYYRLKYVTGLSLIASGQFQLKYIQLLKTEVSNLASGLSSAAQTTLLATLNALLVGHPP